MASLTEDNERVFNVIGGYFCGSQITFKNVPEEGLIMTIGFDSIPGRPDPIYHIYRIDGADLLYCGESLDPVTTIKPQ